MESDGLPPLKMKCLEEGLSLNSINDKSKSMGEGRIVTFQMAATQSSNILSSNPNNCKQQAIRHRNTYQKATK